MAYTFNCGTCGQEHTARRSDARHCPDCRLWKDLVYCSAKFKRPKKCRACGRGFRPVHVRDLSHCGRCSAEYSKLKLGRCAACGTDEPLVRGTAIGLPCAKDPDRQIEVIARLRKRQNDRPDVVKIKIKAKLERLQRHLKQQESRDSPKVPQTRSEIAELERLLDANRDSTP